MPFQFSNPSTSVYQSGDIFLGRDPATGLEIGIKADRHIITIAGSGGGKGAALLIPNLKRWPHNALVIDPKGENAERTWRDREALGQKVHILDPFGAVEWRSAENPDGVPRRLRSSLNPIAALDPSKPTIREDIRTIADGLVIRYKSDDATWDNGAVSVIAGMIAHAVASCDPNFQSLTAVRSLLRLPDDDLEPVFQAMAQSQGMGGLAQTAAAIGLSQSKKNKEFVGGARDHTEWLDSEPMEKVLGSSDFSLSDLKTGKTTVFLVLPPQYLAEHGRFLRLFVRCALNAMASGGQSGKRCLFMLDEFFSLGYIDEIAKSAGLMRSYGVQLWPFLQDFGQLQTLYSPIGAMTFFGNSDAHIYFNNTDQLTLDHISKRLDKIKIEELGIEPPVKRLIDFPDEVTNFAFSPVAQPSGFPSFGGKHAGKVAILGFGVGIAQRVFYQDNLERQARVRHFLDKEQQRLAQEDENERRKYEHAMRAVGQPRLTPLEVAETVSKRDGDKVARSMIVFGKGSDVFNLSLAPYFVPYVPPIIISDAEIKAREIQKDRIIYAHEWYLREYDNQRLKLAKKAIPGAMAMGAMGGFFVGVLISSSLSGGFFFAGLAGCLLGWIASFDTADERKRAPRLYQQIMEDAAKLNENNALPTIEEMTAMRKSFPLNQRDTWEYGPFDPAAPRVSLPLIRPLEYPEKFSDLPLSPAGGTPAGGSPWAWNAPPLYTATIDKNGG